jgi:GntR family transcriptional regulator
MILLDYKDSRPIYEQVTEKLLELMVLGVLEEDEQMPSVRSLATELSINPNTIQRAYGELERRGYIYTVKGRGSFVGSIGKLREARKEELAQKIGALAKEAQTLGISRGEFIEMAGMQYENTVVAGHPADESTTAAGIETSEKPSDYK